MINEQIILDALVLNEWIREHRYTKKDFAEILNYYFSNISKFKFQNESKYIIRLTNKLKYHDKL